VVTDLGITGGVAAAPALLKSSNALLATNPSARIFHSSVDKSLDNASNVGAIGDLTMAEFGN
jgi:tRNA A37 threonylcarbamoyltransferase TsaD